MIVITAKGLQKRRMLARKKNYTSEEMAEDLGLTNREPLPIITTGDSSSDDEYI